MEINFQSNMTSKEIQKLDQMIREGLSNEVRLSLQKVSAPNIARIHRRSLAAIARRVGMPLLGLNLLNSVIQPGAKYAEPARDEEFLEYAANLIRIGSYSEAFSLIQNHVKHRDNPEIDLQLAAFQTRLWNSPNALPHLRRYIANKGINAYQRNVGLINLASGLIAVGDFDEAVDILKRSQQEMKPEDRLIKANSFEILARAYYNKKDYERAKESLDKCFEILDKAELPSRSVAERMKLVLELERAVTPRVIAELKEHGEKVRRRGQWEAIREAEYLEAKYTNNEELFNRVYFGTPYERYRELLRKRTDGSFSLFKSYVWRSGTTTEIVFDALTGKIDGQGASLKEFELLYRLFQELCADFYRPRLLGELYSVLFPGEYFNPQSSPDRIYQAVKRLRKWLLKHTSGKIEVSGNENGYCLTLKEGVGIRKYLSQERRSKKGRYLREVEILFCGSLFTAKEARLRIGVSTGFMQNLLVYGMRNKVLIKEGTGSGTRYRFINKR